MVVCQDLFLYPEGGDEKERKSDGKCKVYEKDGTFTLVQESLIVL